jgi:hypothetical protein
LRLTARSLAYDKSLITTNMARWAPSAARGGDAFGRVEAPVTLRGYLLCVFAAFGGILFGYDSGYINGVIAMNYFKQEFGGQ